MAKTHDLKTAADILLHARIATHTLQAARKQAVSKYDEDLRALKELDLKLGTIQSVNEPELFDPGLVLSPEIRTLILYPLAKYGA
jgi:hypothetical protein